ncbi:hypothetical protein VAR608DRAFT_0316 [Variovorax sp. HW608]|uniref:hypothetical protein n=1 Tax=Variovorax sp. HW608 TaxID=1034889 RepID=UPI00081FF3F7|nr:hypothetical protein [Variovorax sp. HW608]SCK09166.1 hypothetical protein VAR608DRAFT_0316 [Variovorax sp. HW608]
MSESINEVQAAINETLSSPSSSDWIKRGLSMALDRDPVDAAHDADRLADLLGRRCIAVLQSSLEMDAPARRSDLTRHAQ